MLLFSLTALHVFEAHFLLFFSTTFILLLSHDYKISKFSFNLIIILLILIIIGVFSSLFNQKIFYDWLKDFMYFLKPVLGIVTGYFLVSRINDRQFFFRAIIYIAVVFSIFHIIGVVVNTDFSTDSINEIRKHNGISNLLELMALVVLVGSYKFKYLNVVKSRLIKKIILLILSISIVFYFSRTMLIAFIIMGLAVNGYTKLSTKGLKYGVILLSLIGAFYIYLFSVDIKRDQPGIDSFLYKMKIAPTEIFSSSVEIDKQNHENLWDYWRAYEVDMAIDQMNIQRFSYFMGFGFGSLVDLKFKAPLNKEGMRYIPLLHNGYVYLVFKTGFIGLFFYIIFLGYLYIQSYKKNKFGNEIVIRNLISGIGLFFIFTSLITTGIFNSNEIYTFFLGGFLFLLYDTNSLQKSLDQ